MAKITPSLSHLVSPLASRRSTKASLAMYHPQRDKGERTGRGAGGEEDLPPQPPLKKEASSILPYTTEHFLLSRPLRVFPQVSLSLKTLELCTAFRHIPGTWCMCVCQNCLLLYKIKPQRLKNLEEEHSVEKGLSGLGMPGYVAVGFPLSPPLFTHSSSFSFFRRIHLRLSLPARRPPPRLRARRTQRRRSGKKGGLSEEA